MKKMRVCKANVIRRCVELYLVLVFYVLANELELNLYETIVFGAMYFVVALALLLLVSLFTQIHFDDCCIIVKRPLRKEKKIFYADIGSAINDRNEPDSLTLFDKSGKKIVSINTFFSNYYTLKRIIREKCVFNGNTSEAQEASDKRIKRIQLICEKKAFDITRKKARNLCEECIDEGEYDVAIKLASRALENQKDDDICYLLAKALLLNGQIDECRQVINECLFGVTSKHLGLYEIAGELALYDGRYDEAKSFFMKLDDGKNGFPGVEKQAICLYKSGLLDDAERLLDCYIENENWAIKKNSLLLKFEINLMQGNVKKAKKILKEYTSCFGDVDLEIQTRKALFDVLCNRVITARVRVSMSYSPLYGLIDALIWPGLMLKAIDYTCYGNDYEMYWKDKESYHIISKADIFICYSLHYWIKGMYIDAKGFACDGLNFMKEKYGEIENLSNPKVLCEFAFLYLLANQKQEVDYCINTVKGMKPCGEHLCAECYCANIIECLMFARYNEKEKSQKAFNKLPDWLKNNHLLKKTLRKTIQLNR